MSLSATQEKWNGGLSREMLNAGLVSAEQLSQAEAARERLGGELTQILLKKGAVREPDLLAFFARFLGIPTVNLKETRANPLALRQVPYYLAQKYEALPLDLVDGVLTLAVSDASRIPRIEEDMKAQGRTLRFVMAPRQAVQNAVSQSYQVGQFAKVHSEGLEIEAAKEGGEAAEGEATEERASSFGAVSIVNALLEGAIRDRASDIHIEPQENHLRVRFRIDGALEERQILPSRMLLPVVSRIKIVSGMNIAERRAPQDGRFSLRARGQRLDCRVSSYPTVFGEKVVIRLLAKGDLKSLEQLGMTPADQQKFRASILRPHGLILVTGPTGSGKSTTLYSALRLLNSIDRNIMSIEDPVENEMPGVNQAQLNPKAHVTFASAMKSMLRQDPDVIMVGEIRDPDTADMALRAALTGHLVLSTLHTNTAVGAVARLVNLGMPPFLVASSLIAVLGQRLVRKLCSGCREKAVAGDEASLIGLERGCGVYRGAGCEACRFTGFASRIGVFELLTMDPVLREHVEKGASEEEIYRMAREQGFAPLVEDGRAKVLEGTTSLSEVIRVTEAF